MTKVQAIIQLLKVHKGSANWKTIYENLEKYYPAIKASNFWQEGIRGVVYREKRYGRNFTVKDGVVSLRDNSAYIYNHDHEENRGKDCVFHD